MKMNIICKQKQKQKKNSKKASRSEGERGLDELELSYKTTSFDLQRHLGTADDLFMIRVKEHERNKTFVHFMIL